MGGGCMGTDAWGRPSAPPPRSQDTAHGGGGRRIDCPACKACTAWPSGAACSSSGSAPRSPKDMSAKFLPCLRCWRLASAAAASAAALSAASLASLHHRSQQAVLMLSGLGWKLGSHAGAGQPLLAAGLEGRAGGAPRRDGAAALPACTTPPPGAAAPHTPHPAPALARTLPPRPPTCPHAASGRRKGSRAPRRAAARVGAPAGRRRLFPAR